MADKLSFIEEVGPGFHRRWGIPAKQTAGLVQVNFFVLFCLLNRERSHAGGRLWMKQGGGHLEG